MKAPNHTRDEAVGLLQHYFGLLARQTGIKWDSDNDTEIAEIVDLIINAARGPK